MLNEIAGTSPVMMGGEKTKHPIMTREVFAFDGKGNKPIIMKNKNCAL